MHAEPRGPRSESNFPDSAPSRLRVRKNPARVLIHCGFLKIADCSGGIFAIIKRISRHPILESIVRMKSAITLSLVEEARGGPFVFWGDAKNAILQAQRLGFDAIEIFPPLGIASTALKIKFVSASRNSDSSPRIVGVKLRSSSTSIEAPCSNA